MISKEVISLKIMQVLVEKYGYKPIKFNGNPDGIYLGNPMDGNYPIIYLSNKDAMPNEQMSDELASNVSNQIKKQTMLLTLKIGVIAFGPAILKYETSKYDVFMCTENQVHVDLEKKFPEITNIIKGVSPQESAVKIRGDINNVMMQEAIKTKMETAKMLSTNSNFILFALVIPMLILSIGPTMFLVQTEIIGADHQFTILGQAILSGASYAPFTFGMNQYWRLVTNIFSIDIVGIAILVFIFYYSQRFKLLENFYGRGRSIAIILISGTIMTLATTVFYSSGAYNGIFPIIAILLTMLVYFGYYNRATFMTIYKNGIMSLVLLIVIASFMSIPDAVASILVVFVTLAVCSIIGFKNSEFDRMNGVAAGVLVLAVVGLFLIQDMLSIRAYTTVKDANVIVEFLSKIGFGNKNWLWDMYNKYVII